MPGFFTDYANNKILDMVFGATPFTPPPTLFVGLSQIAANRSGAASEPSGGGYTRVPVSNNLANFPASSSGAKSNTAVIAFPAPSGGWGTVVSLFVADSASGGNILSMADLTAPRTINAGGAPATVAAGALFLSHA